MVYMPTLLVVRSAEASLMLNIDRSPAYERPMVDKDIMGMVARSLISRPILNFHQSYMH